MKRLIVLLPMALLAGCSHELTCSDSATKSEVIDVVTSNLLVPYVDLAKAREKGHYQELAVEDIQTTSHDKDTRQYACHAKLTWSSKSKANSVEFDYQTNFLEDKGKSVVSVDLAPIKGAFYYEALGDR